MSASAALGQDFRDVIAYLNRSIHQAIGLPSLMADAGQVGSYSLGQQHADTFDRLCKAILHELIEVLLEQLVRQLIEWNFTPDQHGWSWGDFQVEEFDAEVALKLATVAEKLVASEIVDTERLADINHLRSQQGLSLLAEEDLSPSYPSLPGALPTADASFSQGSRARSVTLPGLRKSRARAATRRESLAHTG